jgi:hypothetical protein
MPPEYFKALGIDKPTDMGDYFVNLRDFLRAKQQVPDEMLNEILEQKDRAVRRPWRAEDYPHLAAWLEANEKPLALLIEASRHTHYYHPVIAPREKGQPTGLINARLTSIQSSRELAEILMVLAMHRLSEKKYDDAWQVLQAAHRFSRLIGRGSTLIDGLVGISLDRMACMGDIAYLQHADLDSVKIQARMADLRNLPAVSPAADKIDLAERCFALEMFQALRRAEPITVHDIPIKKPSGRAKAEKLEVLDKLDWQPGLRMLNDAYDHHVANLRLQDPQAREAEIKKYAETIGSAKKFDRNPNLLDLLSTSGPIDASYGKTMAEYFISQFSNVASIDGAWNYVPQRQRNLQVAFALAAYQRDQGRYPAKLADLSPKYLAAIPNDIFTGKDLIYRPEEKGYLLYSVGRNGKDEGGRTFEDDPAGDDESVRMPLPEPPVRK